MDLSIEVVPTIVDRVEEVLLLARDGGRTVGSVGIKFEKRCAFMRRLFVADDCRRRGVGASLLRRATDEACRLGKESLGLVVEATNEDAIRLYRRFDFIIGHEYDDGTFSMFKPLVVGSGY